MIKDQTPAWKIHWMLNLWPPLFFQGIRVRNIDPNFQFADVDVKRSLLTRNIMGTTFGGALMTAADPFYPILYWRTLANEGHSLRVWRRSLEGDFQIPADQTVRLHFSLPSEQLEKAREGINGVGGVDLVDVVNAVLPGGKVAARFQITSSLRRRSCGSSPIRSDEAID